MFFMMVAGVTMFAMIVLLTWYSVKYLGNQKTNYDKDFPILQNYDPSFYDSAEYRNRINNFRNSIDFCTDHDCKESTRFVRGKWDGHMKHNSFDYPTGGTFWGCKNISCNKYKSASEKGINVVGCVCFPKDGQ